MKREVPKGPRQKRVDLGDRSRVQGCCQSSEGRWLSDQISFFGGQCWRMKDSFFGRLGG